MNRNQIQTIVALGTAGVCPDDIAEILKLAQACQNDAIAQCNYQRTERQITRAERVAARLIARLAEVGLVARVEGDPRGYVCKVTGPGSERFPQNWGDENYIWTK